MQTPPENASELQIQSKAFQKVWNELPQTRGLLFKVTNENTRGPVAASQAKASGLVAGIPDMLFAWDGKLYGFEFKTPSGMTSPEQERIHAVWAGHNIPVWIVRDVETMYNIILRIIAGLQLDKSCNNVHWTVKAVRVVYSSFKRAG